VEFILGLNDFRQDDLPESFELRLAAEEARFSNRNFVQQCGQFCLPRGLESQALKVFAQAGSVGLFHPPSTAVKQETEFGIGMEDACDLVNEVTDTNEFGFRGTVTIG
jgi:hypothetical protein